MIKKRTNDCDRSKFTLDQSLTYQIKIAGRTSENWSDWTDQMDIQVEAGTSGFTTTTLTGMVDQAALIGLLRQLYYLGFPLIAVNCIQSHQKNNDCDHQAKQKQPDQKMVTKISNSKKEI